MCCFYSKSNKNNHITYTWVASTQLPNPGPESLVAKCIRTHRSWHRKCHVANTFQKNPCDIRLMEEIQNNHRLDVENSRKSWDNHGINYVSTAEILPSTVPHKSGYTYIVHTRTCIVVKCRLNVEYMDLSGKGYGKLMDACRLWIYSLWIKSIQKQKRPIFRTVTCIWQIKEANPTTSSSGISGLMPKLWFSSYLVWH